MLFLWKKAQSMRRYQEVSISAGRVRTTHLGKACAMRTLRLLLIASNENEQPRRKRRGIKTKDHCKSVRPKGRGIDPLPAYSHGMMQGQEPPAFLFWCAPRFGRLQHARLCNFAGCIHPGNCLHSLLPSTGALGCAQRCFYRGDVGGFALINFGFHVATTPL